MYFLASGDRNNTEALALIQEYPERANELRGEKTFRRAQYMLFKNGHLDSKQIRTLESIITMGDELTANKGKISLEDARIMFFALNFNYRRDNPPYMIENMEMARNAYYRAIEIEAFNKHVDTGRDIEECKKTIKNADYRLSDMPDTDRKRNPKCDIKELPSYLYKGTDIKINILVSFFKDANGNSRVVLSKERYIEVKVFGKKYNVPIGIVWPFFTEAKKAGQGRICYMAAESDKIREACNLECHKDTFIKMLEYCGLSQTYMVDVSYGETELEDNLLWMRINDETNCEFDFTEDEHYNLWKRVKNDWVLLDKTEYIPIKFNNDLVLIIS